MRSEKEIKKEQNYYIQSLVRTIYIENRNSKAELRVHSLVSEQMTITIKYYLSVIIIHPKPLQPNDKQKYANKTNKSDLFELMLVTTKNFSCHQTIREQRLSLT